MRSARDNMRASEELAHDSEQKRVPSQRLLSQSQLSSSSADRASEPHAHADPLSQSQHVRRR